MAADSTVLFNPAVRAMTEGVSLSDQVALVTGGSRGIGRALSVALARAGAAVCVVARNQDRLDETRREIEQLGVPVCTVATDVGDPDGVAAAVEQATSQLGPIDLLVNNAGTQTSIGDCAEVDPGAWWSDVNVNLRGPMLLMRQVLPGMIERRRGRVVNVASNAAWQPFPHVSSYAAAKAALVRMTETAALETREHGVSLFAISPGTVKTELMDYTSHKLTERSEFDSVLGSISLDFIPPTFAADLVVALASGAADALSGRFITVHDDLPAYVRELAENPASARGMLRIAGS
jgi:NAD(P)-dependent dehydrogenase (short-subunit alcohol dehydrogenase family)